MNKIIFFILLLMPLVNAQISEQEYLYQVNTLQTEAESINKETFNFLIEQTDNILELPASDSELQELRGYLISTNNILEDEQQQLLVNSKISQIDRLLEGKSKTPLNYGKVAGYTAGFGGLGLAIALMAMGMKKRKEDQMSPGLMELSRSEKDEVGLNKKLLFHFNKKEKLIANNLKLLSLPGSVIQKLVQLNDKTKALANKTKQINIKNLLDVINFLESKKDPTLIHDLDKMSAFLNSFGLSYNSDEYKLLQDTMRRLKPEERETLPDLLMYGNIRDVIKAIITENAEILEYIEKELKLYPKHNASINRLLKDGNSPVDTGSDVSHVREQNKVKSLKEHERSALTKMQEYHRHLNAILERIKKITIVEQQDLKSEVNYILAGNIKLASQVAAKVQQQFLSLKPAIDYIESTQNTLLKYKSALESLESEERKINHLRLQTPKESLKKAA